MDTPILSSTPKFNKSQTGIIKIAAWGQVTGMLLNFLAIIMQGSEVNYDFFEGPLPSKDDLVQSFPTLSAILYSLSLLVYIPSVSCMVSLYAQLGAPISSGLMSVGAALLAVTYSSALGIAALIPYLSQEIDDSVFTSLYLIAVEFGGFASNFLAFSLPTVPFILATVEVGSDLTPKWALGTAVASLLTTVAGVVVDQMLDF